MGRVTGHSLGAALAGLAALSLESYGYQIEEVYTFGMPRTGDAIWAKDFNARFSDRFFRVTHHEDPVVQIPPDYLIVDWHFEHVSQRSSIPATSARATLGVPSRTTPRARGNFTTSPSTP